MAGIYIHIPYCKKICPYCDFHKSGYMVNKKAMIQSMLKEINLQKEFLKGEKIETIYFGGGTPSLLLPEEILNFIEKIKECFLTGQSPEITMEANPDDLLPNYLKKIYNTGVNRLSIGCQSFNDETLRFLGRRHTAKQSFEAVQSAKESGFKNISLDLIYGIPGQILRDWEEDLTKALSLDVFHISAYHLTFEEKTIFYKKLKSGVFKEVKESLSNEMFQTLINETAKHNFIHYEISNFAKKGFFSKHNTNYWKQKKYLGIGPSAHSYDRNRRQWNISNNKKYIDSLEKGKVPFKEEILTAQQKYNEYIMTSLRTIWGIDLEYLENHYSKETRDYCLNIARKFLQYGLIKKEQKQLILTEQGKFVSDNILAEMMMV